MSAPVTSLEEPADAVHRPARGGDARARLLRLWGATTWWQRALLVYAATRLFGALVIERTARFQAASLWTPADPGYLEMGTLWDASWYEEIATNGYPDAVPRGPDGRALQNAWAFYPLFPLLVRAVMGVTGGSFAQVGPTVALLLGAAAVVAVAALLRHVAGDRAALGGVVLLCCAPAAPVLQIAYTESLALLLLAAALLLLVRRQYLAAVPVVVLLALARPVVLPLAGVVGVHVLWRWWRRREDPFPPRQAGQAVLLGAATAVAGWLWPSVAWAVTGDASAYTDTMASWRSSGEVVPVRPWLDVSSWLIGPAIGPLLVLGGVAVVVATLLAARSMRALGIELQAWCALYLAYLVVVLDPFTSLVRYLLLLFPVGAAVTLAGRGRAHVAALAACGLVSQVVWVVWLLRFEPPSDWPP